MNLSGNDKLVSNEAAIESPVISKSLLSRIVRSFDEESKITIIRTIQQPRKVGINYRSSCDA